DALMRYQDAMMRRDLTSGEDFGWMHQGFSKELIEKLAKQQIEPLPALGGLVIRGQNQQDFEAVLLAVRQAMIASPDDYLYHRPSFTSDYRVLNDLTQHAPALNTTFADIQAVLEAESDVTAPARGAVDPEARRLIDRARAAGWQRVTYPAKDGEPAFTIVVNGAGQFAHERMLPSGLREPAICDGKHLMHLYEEIGLGARRIVGGAHRRDLVHLVPWLVLPVEDLARGADVKLVN